ncbi:hypothetical protein NDU88_002801 [Pleurodeles waltl]|uniref:Uncharacterized protein n=1 Tax=Pleurodeles waltl TaxID=8319 RepID=A0AAV7LDH4_PLEWA|nr:hypothetical protein NDU88_002801 [Pleurodeles waltl]
MINAAHSQIPPRLRLPGDWLLSDPELLKLRTHNIRYRQSTDDGLRVEFGNGPIAFQHVWNEKGNGR